MESSLNLFKTTCVFLFPFLLCDFIALYITGSNLSMFRACVLWRARVQEEKWLDKSRTHTHRTHRWASLAGGSSRTFSLDSKTIVVLRSLLLSGFGSPVGFFLKAISVAGVFISVRSPRWSLLVLSVVDMTVKCYCYYYQPSLYSCYDPWYHYHFILFIIIIFS